MSSGGCGAVACSHKLRHSHLNALLRLPLRCRGDPDASPKSHDGPSPTRKPCCNSRRLRSARRRSAPSRSKWAVSANLSFGGDGKASFAINPTGSLSIAVLNDAADVDEDQLVGQAGPAKGLGPQLQLDDKLAYLKLRAEAGVKASGAVSLGSLIGVDAGGEASVTFADYRAFPRGAAMLEALRKTIDGGARFVTKLDDVLELGVNEALMLRRKGTLATRRRSYVVGPLHRPVGRVEQGFGHDSADSNLLEGRRHDWCPGKDFGRVRVRDFEAEQTVNSGWPSESRTPPVSRFPRMPGSTSDSRIRNNSRASLER